jgi:hypothetical protein
MTAHREEIWKSAAPRIVDEFVRMLNQGAAAASFPLLAELGMLEGLLPGFAGSYANPQVRAQVQRNLVSLDAHQKPQGGLPAGLALAVLYHPLFAAAVAAAGPDADRGKIAAELLDADLGKLKFPRAQLEKAVLLLAGQQRLTQPQRRRGRGGTVASRPWFAEALALLEITQGDTPEGRAALRRLRSQQHQAAAEQREAPGAEPAPDVPEDQQGTADAGEPAEEAGAARTTRRRRRSRRGAGRGRKRTPEPGETPETAGEDGGRQDAPDVQPPPAAAHPRQGRRAPVGEDAPIDPDAAFGDGDTDLEPPGGESTEDRTD